MRNALIVFGGWDGHEPEQVSAHFKKLLERNNFKTSVLPDLSCFEDAERLAATDLIVPVYTMSQLTAEQEQGVMAAVEKGTGIAGCHGGMCDAFRNSVGWQFMTGGQWVAHPGNDGVAYTVNVRREADPMVADIEDFQVTSEHYYLHVDPAVRVLASTRFPLVDGPHAVNGPVDMPVIWTKLWGAGRVFYNSLGHHADIIEAEPASTLMERGFLWAARR